MLRSIKTGKEVTLLERAADARYLPTGHLLYAVGGAVFARAFDLGRWELSGPTVPVLEGVRLQVTTGALQYAFTNDGTVVYLPGPAFLSSGLGL